MPVDLFYFFAIQDISSDGNVYGRLAKSIAPEIFGHEDVKKVQINRNWFVYQIND